VFVVFTFAGEVVSMLVELGLVEQRYRAVQEVLVEGATVTEVAARYGVVRQTVHSWLRDYAREGLGGNGHAVGSRTGTSSSVIRPCLQV
jgi:transposase-like protein